MQSLSEQLAPVLALAAAKGVDLGIPAVTRDVLGQILPIHHDDLVVTGSLSAWLAGQGIAVMNRQGRGWIMVRDDGLYNWLMHSDSHLSAILAAATARLAELPSAAPASKEGE